jgi:hypothetical protein
MMLDIVANNNWKRPIYYGAFDNEDYLGLKDSSTNIVHVPIKDAAH